MPRTKVYYPLPSNPTSRAHAVITEDHGDGTVTIQFSNATTRRVELANLEPRL